MNESQAKASLKAAAFTLVALLGWAKAVAFLREVAAQIENDEWSGPGSR